ARVDLTEELIHQLLSQPGIEVKTDVFKKAADHQEPSTDTVAFKAGKREVLWRQVKPAWEQFRFPTDQEGLIKAFEHTRAVIEACIMHYHDRELAEGKAQGGETAQRARTLVVGGAYLDYLFQKKLEGSITEADLQKYYDDNKRLAYALPQLLAYDSIILPLPKEQSNAPGSVRDAALKHLQEQLTDTLKTLKSAADFSRVAKEMNQSSGPPPE